MDDLYIMNSIVCKYKASEVLELTEFQVKHEDCHMQEKCSQYEMCPMNLVNKIISGKWKMLILWYLSNKKLRFSDIQNKLPNVAPKVLSRQLKSLEQDNLINRKAYPVVPPKVEYSLTEVGRRLLPILEMMHKFGVEYLKDNMHQ